MRYLMKKIGSLTLAAALTLSLCGRAFADEGEPDLPVEAPTEIIDTPVMPEVPAGTADAAVPGAEAEGTAAGIASEGAGPEAVNAGILPQEEENLEKDEEAGDEGNAGGMETAGAGEFTAAGSAFEEAPAAGGEEDPEQNTDDGTDPQTQEPTLTIGSSVVSMTTGGSGDGWSYDADDGSLILVNCSGGEEIVTSGTGMTIKAAGVNVLSSLVIDGEVNLVGTGILLVDSIELAEGCDFNLLTNTGIYEDEAGSVAVFLKQEDGTYLLMNDKVNAPII